MLSYVVIADCSGVRELSNRIEKSVKAKGRQLPGVDVLPWVIRNVPTLMKLGSQLAESLFTGLANCPK